MVSALKVSTYTRAAVTGKRDIFKRGDINNLIVFFFLIFVKALSNAYGKITNFLNNHNLKKKKTMSV